MSWSIRRGFALPLAAVVCAWGLMTGFAAAEGKAAVQRHSAIPDWNGVWVIANSFMDKQDGTEVAAPGRFDPAETASLSANLPAFKGAYLAGFQAAKKAAAEGRPISDRGALCLPQGMPAFWGGPYAFEVLQTPKQINIYQEWNEQTRRIYLDERQQPADLDPSYNGHSIGHWEGGVLVIDTVAIRSDTSMTGEGGGHHSDAIHVTERLQSEGHDRLKVQETVEDSKAFLRPWVKVIHLHRKPGMEIIEYVCEQNNRNPVNANGVTGVTLGK